MRFAKDERRLIVGDHRDREGVLWAGSVLELRFGVRYRVHVPTLSDDAPALAAALEAHDLDRVRELRYESIGAGPL